MVSDPEPARLDRGTKYAVGLIHARLHAPSHVVFFDSDDLLHRDIAAFVNARPKADGWFIDRGYVYWEGSSRVTPVQGFHKLCGTSNILAFHLVDLPNRLGPTASQDEIIEAAGEFYVRRILGSHALTAEYLIGKGCSIEPLPFRGAVWVRGTGENWLPPKGFPSLGGIKVTAQIRDDFNLKVQDTSLLDEFVASVRQTLLAWRDARQAGGVRSALVETVWRGSRRALSTLRGKEWKL